MWNKIVDDKTLINLLEEVEFFHDACLTELRYISGAYVDEIWRCIRLMISAR